MKDLVSIVVPIYNVEDYLEKCIESILNQTYKNIEVLLINDGSPDNCERICKKYEKKDKRIKYFKQKNAGLSAARNTGIELSTGKYIMFVDSDDYINYNIVEKLYGIIIDNNASIAMCNYKKVYDKDTCDMSKKENGKIVLYRGNKKYSNLFNKLKTVTTIACAKIYDKNLFNDIKYPLGKLHEDEYTMYKLLNLSKKIVYADCKYYYYYQRPNSISKSYNIKRIDILDALKEKMNFFYKKGLKKYYYLAVYDYFYQLLYQKEMISRNYKDQEESLKKIDNEIVKYKNKVFINIYINPLKKLKLILILLNIYKL